MAYWAQIDENNIVTRVTIGSDQDQDGGYQWLVDNIGGTWVQTYQNGEQKGIFASVGDSYNPDLDLFIKKPEEQVLETPL